MRFEMGTVFSALIHRADCRRATAGNQGRLEPSLQSSRCSVFAFTAGQRVSARVRWKCRNSWRRTVGSVSGSGILFPNSLSFVLHPGSPPASLPPPSLLPRVRPTTRGFCGFAVIDSGVALQLFRGGCFHFRTHVVAISPRAFVKHHIPISINSVARFRKTHFKKRNRKTWLDMKH